MIDPVSELLDIAMNSLWPEPKPEEPEWTPWLIDADIIDLALNCEWT